MKNNVFVNRETISYFIFGILTTIISIFFFEIFYWQTQDAFISNIFSSLIAIIFAYITNKIWVFRALSFSLSKITVEFAKFFSGRIFTLVLETLLLALLIDVLGFNQFVTKIFTSTIVIILNYIISKLGVFNNPKEANNE